MRATPVLLLAVAAARGLLASAGQRRLEDAAAPADRAAGPKAPQEEAIVLAKAFRVAEGSNDRFAMIGPEPVADRRATQNILSFLGRVAFSIALVPAMWFTAREWYGAKVDSESSRSTHAFFLVIVDDRAYVCESQLCGHLSARAAGRADVLRLRRLHYNLASDGH